MGSLLRPHELGVSVDEGAVGVHDSIRLGHLILTESNDPLQHGPRYGFVEDGLDAAESDDETILGSRAAPFRHARQIEVGCILLDVSTRQASFSADDCLGERDAVVFLRLGVSVADTSLKHDLV